ncbi:MAG TPA: adenosylcobinamide-phosphate synthase CbiB [Stellaceae bacterium]|nr:adenosylcobinamide-phosphate synthase CbiB [Stellaceae bacterium]
MSLPEIIATLGPFPPPLLFDGGVLLPLALILDGLIGEAPFRYLPHPVVLIGGAIGFLDRRLNREHRTDRTRRLRGLAVLVALVSIGAGIGWAIHRLARMTGWGWGLELALVAALVAQRSLYQHVAAVAAALESGGPDHGLAAGREAVSRIVGRDPASLDTHGVARAAIESLAENFGDGVVGPVFWYLIAGLPGIIAYKTVNTLDSMIGHLGPRYRAFGWASARFDDLVNLAPARLAGLLLALAAAILPRGRPIRAITTMLSEARKHRSPNAGWPEAAMAGALDLALAGPRRYGDHVVDDPWIGTGRARATPGDIRRALAVFVMACLIELFLVAAIGQLRAP